jgi:rRNA maturation protein Nop10
MLPKILYLDIETAPKTAWVWKFWKENISPKQLVEDEWIMSFSALWGDSDEIIYEENHNEDDFEIVAKLIRLLDEADIVIGHNVKKFDCATISWRALVAEVPPPSPYKIVDTYSVAKDKFNIPSNSLEYIAMILKVKHKKLAHAKFPGFILWRECLAENPEAWDEMKVYNCEDTFTVRDVYYAMRPWITNHPNLGVYMEENIPVCPKCGGKHLHARGYAYTSVGKYKKYRCVDCGGWSRGRQLVNPKEKRGVLLVNA